MTNEERETLIAKSKATAAAALKKYEIHKITNLTDISHERIWAETLTVAATTLAHDEKAEIGAILEQDDLKPLKTFCLAAFIAGRLWQVESKRED